MIISNERFKVENAKYLKKICYNDSFKNLLMPNMYIFFYKHLTKSYMTCIPYNLPKIFLDVVHLWSISALILRKSMWGIIWVQKGYREICNDSFSVCKCKQDSTD